MAKQQIDILLNDALEVQYSGGDLALGESTERHQQLLLIMRPGQIPFYLLAGVGIADQYQNDAGERQLARLIQREFTADGLTFNVLRVRNLATQDVQINAYYK